MSYPDGSVHNVTSFADVPVVTPDPDLSTVGSAASFAWTATSCPDIQSTSAVIERDATCTTTFDSATPSIVASAKRQSSCVSPVFISPAVTRGAVGVPVVGVPSMTTHVADSIPLLVFVHLRTIASIRLYPCVPFETSTVSTSPCGISKAQP